MYIVGFNGPPGSGKDTLAQMVVDHMLQQRVPFVTIRQESLSMPLRQVAYAIVGWKGELDGVNYAEFKQTVFPIGGGTTGRQLMIDTSERFLKQCYGETVMADMLLGRNANFHGVVLVRDSGFQCEVDPFVNAVGEHNVYIVRLNRPEYTFEGDSREWVKHTHMSRIENNGGLESLRTEAGRIYSRLVNQMGWQL